MSSWRGTWAKAQICGAMFSSLVWIVLWGLSLRALSIIVAVGIVAVVGRNTRAMLWCRYGATPANELQRAAMLTAIVPISSLRGRHQPSILISRQLGGGSAVMPTRALLVVSQDVLGQVLNGQLTDRQASAMISHALGQCQVNDSTMVNAIGAYCLPWQIIKIFTRVANEISHRNSILVFSWRIRWIVFGLAAVDAYRGARWGALAGVILISVLSWSISHLDKRWVRRLQDLGDQRAIAEGLGPDLADLIQRGDSSLTTGERADRLRSGTPGQADGGATESMATPLVK